MFGGTACSGIATHYFRLVIKRFLKLEAPGTLSDSVRRSFLATMQAALTTFTP
jgi:hypothetical protein